MNALNKLKKRAFMIAESGRYHDTNPGSISKASIIRSEADGFKEVGVRLDDLLSAYRARERTGSWRSNMKSYICQLHRHWRLQDVKRNKL